ncbi:MAG: metallopeptidase TldD-related protein [Lachnospiraceae bacterium]|nr:metallopeptidase TldD-related protein [Lachnospiraceae bacterium]
MIRYINLLKEAGVNEFQIVDTFEESSEMFFVKKKLDMRRMKNVEKIVIAIYKEMEEDGKKLKGRADVIGNPYMSDEEWTDKIKAALFSAGFVKNPTYSLPPVNKSEKVVVKSDISGMKLIDIADKFVEAVYSQDTDDKAFINSLEVFAVRKTVRVVDSNGSDVSYEKTSFSGEFVAQCKEPEDVETYQNFEYDSLALDEIKSLVQRTLSMTRDRAVATKMPDTGNYDVVISHRYVTELFKLYFMRANTAYVFAKYSDYKVGDKIQGEDVKGDLLNVELVAEAPFDDDAISKVDRSFIEDGVLKTLHGGVRFSEYIGAQKIGFYTKGRVKAGSVSMKEMLNRPCIHIVNFSDFQMDPFDGHFKGEIRLGYLYDGKGNVEIVTGGAVNGSMFEAQKNLTLSSETQKLSDYEGPVAILLKDVSIAGK